MRHSRTALPGWLVPVVGLGAFLALGGGLWDDAWHTERGRDTFFIAPHVAIYGGITLVGAGISLWLLLAARAAGLRAALSAPVLALAAVSVGVTLASAPIDNFWHLAFGRDAVIWSPPHVLGIVGTGSLAVALLVELSGSTRAWARRAQAPVGGLLLAAFAFLVVEYETDVPQFAPLWYLPVLALGAGFAFAVIDRLADQRFALARAAGWHLAFVLAVGGFLMAQDFEPPRVPLLLVPALALDLTRRLPVTARAAAATVALFAVSVPAGYVGQGVRLEATDVLLGAPLAWAALAVTLAAMSGGRPRVPSLPPAPATTLLLMMVLAPSALAHDPGQGPEAGTLDLQITTAGGSAAVTARTPQGVELSPVGLVARRGGLTRRADLDESTPGVFSGRVKLGGPGRWFVYVDLRRSDGRVVEAWLPVDGSGTQPVRDRARFTYLVDRQPSSAIKWIAGIALYVVVVGFLLAVTVLVRRAGGRSAPAGS